MNKTPLNGNPKDLVKKYENSQEFAEFCSLEWEKELAQLMKEQTAEGELFKEYEMKLFKERPKFYKTITTETF